MQIMRTGNPSSSSAECLADELIEVKLLVEVDVAHLSPFEGYLEDEGGVRQLAVDLDSVGVNAHHQGVVVVRSLDPDPGGKRRSSFAGRRKPALVPDVARD